jgi:hypothetical protein
MLDNSPEQWNCQFSRDSFSFSSSHLRSGWLSTALNTIGLKFYLRQINLFYGHFINRFVFYSFYIPPPRWGNSPQWATASSWSGFTITLSHITLGRTRLDEWSAHRRDLYLKTHNSQETHIHVPSGIRTHNPSKRAAADISLRSHGHRDRISLIWDHYNNMSLSVSVFRWKWEDGVIKDIGI